MARHNRPKFNLNPVKNSNQLTRHELERVVHTLVNQQVRQQISTFREEVTISSGPLPPADETAKFEVIHPGFTDRWIAMSEKEQAERFRIINRRDGFEFAYRVLSLIAAVSVTLVLIGGGIALLYHEKKLEGFSAIGLAAASVVGSMIYQGRKKAVKSEEAK